ncbi:alpha/beta hydrolase [Sphingomonas sp. RB3P16]|uniref:alpha/beta hydrolase n=1 Tax=Parasphingomonas frigoris TaxID=3096163 RepID=UPI002FC756B0
MPRLLPLLRSGAMTIAWLMILPCFVILLSAIAPIVPWLRIYAVSVVPNDATWLFLWSFVGLMIGLLAYANGKTRLALALIVIGATATLTTAAVILHLLYVAQSNGARIDVVRALSVREFSTGAQPDESHVYSRPQGEALWLDVYRARKAAANGLSPVIVNVHGGGFFEGSRSFGAANLRWYADQGWTVISIDYRLARDDRPTWNLASGDVECALVWTAAHAGALGIDLDRLALIGGSAGGTLAMSAAYAIDAKEGEPRCGGKMPHVAAVAVKVPLIDAFGSWYNPGELQPLQRSYLTRFLGGPPEQFPERYAAVDLRPKQYPSNPPTLILGGAADPLLPPAAAREFTRRATAAGLNVRHILFPYSGHDFNTRYDGITNQALRQIFAQFLVAHHVGPGPARSTRAKP